MSDNTDENVGKQIGIYNILDVCEERANDGHKLYHVECVFCGWKSKMILSSINRTIKCTHLDQHGNYRRFQSYTWENQRIKNIFHGIKSRCYNQNDKNYRWYGGKGIKICDEWMNNPKLFEDWSVANGYSDELTIDRIDENKNYCPENCRWITLENNAKYKSTTSLITVDGETHTGQDWAKILGFGQNMINTYIREHGMEETIEFIRRFKNNPILKPNHKQSYYDLYMNNNTMNV